MINLYTFSTDEIEHALKQLPDGEPKRLALADIERLNVLLQKLRDSRPKVHYGNSGLEPFTQERREG